MGGSCCAKRSCCCWSPGRLIITERGGRRNGSTVKPEGRNLLSLPHFPVPLSSFFLSSFGSSRGRGGWCVASGDGGGKRGGVWKWPFRVQTHKIARAPHRTQNQTRLNSNSKLSNNSSNDDGNNNNAAATDSLCTHTTEGGSSAFLHEKLTENTRLSAFSPPFLTTRENSAKRTTRTEAPHFQFNLKDGHTLQKTAVFPFSLPPFSCRCFE